MIEIRNLLFQPLTFQLAGEQRGLHLGSRQRKLVDDAQVSEEIRTAAKRGFVALTVLEQSAATKEVVTTPEAVMTPSVEPLPDESVQAPDEDATTSDDAGASLAPETTTDPAEATDQPQPKKRR